MPHVPMTPFRCMAQGRRGSQKGVWCRGRLTRVQTPEARRRPCAPSPAAIRRSSVRSATPSLPPCQSGRAAPSWREDPRCLSVLALTRERRRESLAGLALASAALGAGELASFGIDHANGLRVAYRPLGCKRLRPGPSARPSEYFRAPRALVATLTVGVILLGRLLLSFMPVIITLAGLDLGS
jgi:hypothetical protein